MRTRKVKFGKRIRVRSDMRKVLFSLSEIDSTPILDVEIYVFMDNAYVLVGHYAVPTPSNDICSFLAYIQRRFRFVAGDYMWLAEFEDLLAVLSNGIGGVNIKVYQGRDRLFRVIGLDPIYDAEHQEYLSKQSFRRRVARLSKKQGLKSCSP